MFLTGSFAVLIRAAPPPLQIFAGGLPRRLRRRNAFGLIRDCRRMPIRPKFPNFGKFLSKIFSPILLYCLKNFIKNFLEIVKI